MRTAAAVDTSGFGDSAESSSERVCDRDGLGVLFALSRAPALYETWLVKTGMTRYEAERKWAQRGNKGMITINVSNLIKEIENGRFRWIYEEGV